MELGSLKDGLELVQTGVTILAILLGGSWALYVFFLGRSTTASVQIRADLKYQIVLDSEARVTVISVTFLNTGRTRLRKDTCRFSVGPLTRMEPDRSDLRQHDTAPDVAFQQTWEIFEDLLTLEPNEEAAEDVMFAWDSPSVFSDGLRAFGLVVSFEGNWLLGFRRKRWAKRTVLTA
jgi:hypothetical protein